MSKKLPAAKRGALDLETYEWVNAKCYGLLYGEKGSEQRKWLFQNDTSNARPLELIESLLETMLELRRKERVVEWWAHNGGKYDGLFFFKACKRMGLPFEAFLSGGRVVVLAVGGKQGFRINDSYAVIQSSLSKAGDAFETKHRKVFQKDEYKIDVRLWDRKRLEEGCRADCEVVLDLLNTVEALAVSYEGKLKATFSSLALSIATAHSPIPRLPVEVNEIAQQAYAGGRVEIYHHCPEYALSVWDINSSYPASMAGVLPWNFIGAGDGKKILKGKSEGVVHAQVTVPKMFLPPLPYHAPNLGLFFPTGTWKGWFAGNELRYAQSLGVKVKPIESLEFTAETPFGDFIGKLYEKRKHSKGAVKAFLKLVMNGCYGKLGQGPETEKLVLFEDEETRDATITGEGDWRSYGQVTQDSEDLVWLCKDYNWPKHCHFAAASYITGGGRILLHQFASKALGLSYSDTDSIHASVANTFGDSKELGALKLEEKAVKVEGTYYAPKIYHLKDLKTGANTYAAKGFGLSFNDDEEEMSLNFAKIAAGESVTREVNRLAKKVARLGMDLAREDMTRTWHGGSSKRRAFPNGETWPWTVEEILRKDYALQKSPTFKVSS